MWTSKAQEQNKSEPPNQSEQIKWTQMSSSNFAPSVVEDASSEIGNSRVSQGTCVTQSSHQYGQLLKQNLKEHAVRADRNKPHTVYVNHQGHSVKMARLADPPPMVSFPVKVYKPSKSMPSSGPSTKDDLGPSAKRVLSRNIVQVTKNKKSRQFDNDVFLEMEKQKEGAGKVNHPSISAQDTLVSSNVKYHDLFDGNEHKKIGSSKILGVKSTKAQSVPEVKGSSRTHNAFNEDECTDAHSTTTYRQPSVIKEELENGLKKITADLIALKVLEGSCSEGKDAYAKGDHKRLLSFEHVTEDSEDSKENNSPCKRSRGLLCDPNHVVNIDSRNSSRPSLSHSNLELSHAPKQSTSAPSSMCNINNIIKKKSSFTNDFRTGPSHDKPKSYDPEEAREYIRRKKKERMSRLKAERDRKKADTDAHRQKLNELSRTSMKLVKASIKSKSNLSNGMHSLKPQEDGDKCAPNQERLDSGDNHCANNSVKKQTSDQLVLESVKPSSDLQTTCLDISASPDLSNSQLIRDISDMKSKIEAMAKTLKTTIVSNRARRSLGAIRSEKKVLTSPGQSPFPLFVTKDQPESHFKFKTAVDKLFNEKQIGMKNDSSVEDIMQTNISPAYLHSLTSNLRKMRESLQNVLIQRDFGPSADTLKHEPDKNVNRSLSKNHHFSSVGSEPAFGSLSSDSVNQVHSSDSCFSRNGQKRKITTSFPTLTLANANPVISDRAKHLQATSEADVSGKVSDFLSGITPTESQEVQDPDTVESTSSKQTVVCDSHKPEKDSLPIWLEKFAGKPYPINILSAVKHKLGAVVKDDASSSKGTGTQAAEKQIVTKFTSSELTGKAGIPSTVTVRSGTSFTNEIPALSTSASNLIPPSYSFNPLDRRESFPRPNLLKNYEGDAKFDFRPLSPEPCSILDALNLEKMNIDFVNALDFSPHKSDVIPAEKPLSAPNTPAKGTTRRASSKEEYINSVSSLLSQTDKSEFEDNKSSSSELRSTSFGNDVGNDHAVGLSSIKSNEASSLIPPNINLLTGRVDKDPSNVEKWVSQSRSSGGKPSSNDGQDGNHTGLKYQQNPKFREAFEIGHVFNPTALHLQFQAELNILDSFNESLCQVMEIEKVRAVALARHQALLENNTGSVPKEDKSVDVQKSLMKSDSQISSINYTRGSGDLSEVTLLDTRSSSLGIIDSKQISDDDPNLSVQKECGSPSTVVSDTLSSSVAGKPPLPTQSEDAGASKPSTVSEEIPSTSDNLSEVPENLSEALEVVPIRKGCDDIKCKSEAHGTAQDSTNKPNEIKHVRRTEEALSIDVTVNSFNGDSSLTGNDALLIESLSRSHLFSSITTGEDMFQFTLQMLEQLMHEEELRVQHKNTLLKLRVKVLGEMAHAEVASLDLDKKKLREKGDDGHKDQISALRKKQRGIMLRFQQQREDIERLRGTEELAWQERRLMYLQQMHLIRTQVSTRVMLRKLEKTGENLSKKSRVVVHSIRETRGSKAAQESLAAESGPSESAAIGLSLTHSSSVSLASLVSDASRSSVLSNSSRRPGGAGDSESSHLEDRVLKGLNELESRCRDLKEREKALHERRQSVEQIIQWRRKLDEEEHCLKDVERQAHGRHRSGFIKHALRDRSTSPFQFPDIGAPGIVANGNGINCGRSMSDLVRAGRNNIGNLGGTGSPSAGTSITEEVDSSIPEEISENTSKPSADSTPNATNTDQYANESFESEVSEIKTAESQSTTVDTQLMGKQKEQISTHVCKPDSEFDSRLPLMSERSNKYPGVTIKVPLSPRLQRVQRRRYSSGSDDSMVLSQTETGSEQSDIEGRISALTEQLQQCKTEAERLRREAKRTRNERLMAKEQSLQKQLQAYESYICQLRTNLDAELKQSSVPIVRPQIKQPRVAPGKVASRKQDAGPTPASVSQAFNPDTISVRKEDSEFEAIAIASEAASEATSEAASEATSEVPSDVASELSENSSIVSNEARSLVTNKTATKELLISNEEERTVEALSDASETGSEILSAIITEAQEETSSALLISKEIYEANEKSESSFPTNQHNLGNSHDTCDAQAVDGKYGIVEIIEPVKSLTSEEEPDDVSELLEDEHMEESEIGSSSEVIKVFLREKERDSVDQTSISVEDKRIQMLDAEASQVSTRDELVNRITNEILEGLVKECLPASIHTHSLSIDAVWDSFINKSQTEAADDILSIYKRKKTISPAKSELESGSSRSQDVRKRVNEILAETQSPNVLRAKGRVREMMVTTYGVLSPDDSPCGSPNLASSPVQQLQPSSLSTEETDLSFNNMIESNSDDIGTDNKTQNTQIGLVGVSVVDSEGIMQEWFDEDFGLTRSRREAEELRRQQLQIEQEIEQLQQQQAQVQEHIPYYYVREIPNKPPPPYTPPGQAPRVLSSSSSLSPPVEEIRAVCSDRQTILNCIASAVDLLFDLRSEGIDVSSCEAPGFYVDAGFGLPSPSHLAEQELAVHKNSARVYRLFLFNLAKQLVMNAYSCEQEDPNPPWLRPENWVRRRKALSVVPKTRETLQQYVSKHVLVLFGFIPKASKENLTIRWSRKKRDHVDELLVRESQEEERQWTNYEQDEAVVKNNVTLAILDSLLNDTVCVLSDIFRKRLQRQSDQSVKNKCYAY